MKALEIPIEINDQGKLIFHELSDNVLPKGATGRAIILLDENNNEDALWHELSRRQFFSGYSESDSIYDNYNATG